MMVRQWLVLIMAKLSKDGYSFRTLRRIGTIKEVEKNDKQTPLPDIQIDEIAKVTEMMQKDTSINDFEEAMVAFLE